MCKFLVIKLQQIMNLNMQTKSSNKDMIKLLTYDLKSGYIMLSNKAITSIFDTNVDTHRFELNSKR